MPRPAAQFVPGVRRALATTALAAMAATPLSMAAAQQVRLDEGSFTITVNGQRAGREQFSMQRVMTNDGGTIEVRSESAFGDTRTALRLEADSAGTPVRYSVEARRGAEETLRLGGQRVRGRFATLARSITGESAREYLLRPGAVVVEDDGIVQHALLVRRRLTEGAGVTLPSLTPTANSQGAVRVVLEAERDVVVVAGARRTARRFRIVTANGEARLVWAEGDGLLLRLSIPSRGLDAVRDDVPR
ncbi:hypothetical protein [Gemmatimonas sp.]|uniref:hypothetical protein n=1 Tax=Gemmatimonas sp. TaxID=1962908 RepID=UPI0037BECA78